MTKACADCARDLPIESFRMCRKRCPTGTVTHYRASQCRGCESIARSNRSKATKSWLYRSPEERQQRSLARWLGTYSSRRTPGWYAALTRLGRGYGQAIEAKFVDKCRLAIRDIRKNRLSRKAQWVERLRTERPDLYDSTLSIDSLSYRARYHLDPIFRAAEIVRARAKDSRLAEQSDGTLAPGIIARLFALAMDCPYCHRELKPRDKELDHVIPLSRGGVHGGCNVVVCCHTCNSNKRNRLPTAHERMLLSNKGMQIEKVL